MTVTAISVWTVSNPNASAALFKKAKPFWLKHGAIDYRVGQIFTGSRTGQMLVEHTYEDMAAYAKAAAVVYATKELIKINAALAKSGATLIEREIVMGV
jgi:hypothetical protein